MFKCSNTDTDTDTTQTELRLKCEGDQFDRNIFDQKFDHKVTNEANNEVDNDISVAEDIESESLIQNDCSNVAQQSPLHVAKVINDQFGREGRSSSKKSPRSKIRLRSCKVGQNSPRKSLKLGSKSKIGDSSDNQRIKVDKIVVNKAKSDKNMSLKKIKTIKSYFESLANNKPIPNPQMSPASKEATNDDNIDVEGTETVTKKVLVTERINVFEKMMLSAGDTHPRTPKKRIRRIGNSSSKVRK